MEVSVSKCLIFATNLRGQSKVKEQRNLYVDQKEY